MTKKPEPEYKLVELAPQDIDDPEAQKTAIKFSSELVENLMKLAETPHLDATLWATSYALGWLSQIRLYGESEKMQKLFFDIMHTKFAQGCRMAAHEQEEAKKKLGATEELGPLSPGEGDTIQ